jgi:hypothetical protein
MSCCRYSARFYQLKGRQIGYVEVEGRKEEVSTRARFFSASVGFY